MNCSGLHRTIGSVSQPRRSYQDVTQVIKLPAKLKFTIHFKRHVMAERGLGKQQQQQQQQKSMCQFKQQK